MKRQRGRGRRSGGGGNNPNRHFESNGPDVKIRGSAQQVLDKYLQYARDAQTSGDRVMSEAYFQHAEHYQRLLSAMQPKDKPKRDRDDNSSDDNDDAKSADESRSDTDDNSDTSADNDEGGETKQRPRRRRTKREDRDTGENADSDALKVIDEGEPASAEEAPAPKRRGRPRKTETAKAAGDDADGVMKTLSRGRTKIADASDADAPAEPAAE